MREDECDGARKAIDNKNEGVSVEGLVMVLDVVCVEDGSGTARKARVVSEVEEARDGRRRLMSNEGTVN